MQHNERYHALDAVRGGALLLGVVLHSAAAFLEGFPIPLWKDTPNVTPTVMYYAIHMFRMSTFFLIAGFFARLVVERRGVNAFIKDRAKRIALPFVGFSVLMPVILIGCIVLGALTHGVDNLKSLQQQMQPPGGSSAPGLDLGHLWFLYYLLMFYALALAVRWLYSLGNTNAIEKVADHVVAFVMRGVWAPVMFGLPMAIYFLQFNDWNEWIGMPSPFSIVPSLIGLICYGLPFTLGWMLNRQTPLLLGLQRAWLVYLAAAIALTATCLSIIGTKPFWSGPNLAGYERLLYGIAYMTAVWCWVFGLIATSLRFLNRVSPLMRYLADASYWIYLMHLGVIAFFIMVMRPYQWHWSIKLIIMVSGTTAVLLLSYHYLVRFTWIGGILNGKKMPRDERTPMVAASD